MNPKQVYTVAFIGFIATILAAFISLGSPFIENYIQLNNTSPKEKNSLRDSYPDHTHIKLSRKIEEIVPSNNTSNMIKIRPESLLSSSIFNIPTNTIFKPNKKIIFNIGEFEKTILENSYSGQILLPTDKNSVIVKLILIRKSLESPIVIKKNETLLLSSKTTNGELTLIYKKQLLNIRPIIVFYSNSSKNRYTDTQDINSLKANILNDVFTLYTKKP